MNRLASFAAVILSASALAARGQVERDGGGGLMLAPPPPSPYTEPPATPATHPSAATSIEVPHASAPAATHSEPAATPDTGPLLTMRPNQEATVAAMMGSVNEMPIFVTDLFKNPQLNDQLTRLAQNSRTVADFRQQARTLISGKLNDVVMDAVILSAAEASLTQDERARIDLLVNGDRVQLISKQGGGSEAGAEKWLRSQAIPKTLAQWVIDEKISLKKQIYFSRTISRNIEVTQQMAREAYLADPKKWQVKAQIQLFQITIPASRWLRETKPNGDVGEIPKTVTPEQLKAAETEAMKVARDIAKKLRGGADFARLAEEYHSADEFLENGGKWNKPLEKGALVDKKKEAYFFSLPANSVQDPVLVHDEKYPYTEVIIYKTGEKTEARTIPFTEAQLEIVTQLREEQTRKLQQKMLTQLMSGAAYDAIDRNLEVAVNAAVMRYATK